MNKSILYPKSEELPTWICFYIFSRQHRTNPAIYEMLLNSNNAFHTLKHRKQFFYAYRHHHGHRDKLWKNSVLFQYLSGFQDFKTDRAVENDGYVFAVFDQLRFDYI